MTQLKTYLTPLVIPGLILGGCSTQQRVFDGVYTWGAEVETFSPRGSGEKQWWVLTGMDMRQQLSVAHQRLTTEPYEGIYVKVSGYYAGPATEEKGGPFSLQYEGLFEITKVWLTRKRSTSDCRATAGAG